MGKSIHYHSLAWDILTIVGQGAILASLFVAPNIGLALRPLLRRGHPYERREWERRRVQAALERLRARRYVRYEERGKKTYLVITERGKKRFKEFEFDAMALPERPKRWDRKWRIVIFDIPETKQLERKTLQHKLESLGFFPLQRSVFVYPHPCADEVDFICQFIDADRYVHCLEATGLGSAEGKVRRHFDLL